MRTTLTLDADVSRMVRDRMRESALSLKEVINQALRLGLKREVLLHKRSAPRLPKGRKLGLKKGYSYQNIEELIERLE